MKISIILVFLLSIWTSYNWNYSFIWMIDWLIKGKKIWSLIDWYSNQYMNDTIFFSSSWLDSQKIQLFSSWMITTNTTKNGCLTFLVTKIISFFFWRLNSHSKKLIKKIFDVIKFELKHLSNLATHPPTHTQTHKGCAISQLTIIINQIRFDNHEHHLVSGIGLCFINKVQLDFSYVMNLFKNCEKWVKKN